MSALSRRTILRATGASAAIVVPVLAASAASSDTALLALESRWLAACAEEKRTHDEWRAIYDTGPLPRSSRARGRTYDYAETEFDHLQRQKAAAPTGTPARRAAPKAPARMRWSSIASNSRPGF